ncbi:SCY1-like protein 2 [Microplitis demolitor]|uniref:SCY1-like protein 2 n=1 Tax=Microplitis demolitor TaxID=69319 RepID=UPI00044000CA|nr:SCY1-like protein 2 [Microplitis demolitor]
MDVLNKLRNTVSNTISNTVNSTAYGLSQLSNVLPGNPVTREFEVTAQIASAGPGLLWKIYSGYKKSTKQAAAIFVFEKRLLDRCSSKQEREVILEALKRGVTQLTKLRHPQILTVQHPLEESRDSLAFATEPVFASLANVIGNIENISQISSKDLKDYKLLDVEIKYGLLQLGEGLAFLHSDVKLLHRNLCPESVVINKNGAWKIFGFDFCALNQSPNDKEPSWSYIEYDPNVSSIGQAHLDYQAPESIVAGSCGPPSDIFALGLFIYTLYSPGNRAFNECHGDISKCRRFFADYKTSAASKLTLIPENLRETVKLMLSSNPELRPDAHQFIKIEYFNDIGVKTLNYLEKLFQWDNLQKSQFYKGLPQVMKQLPHRVVLHRVLPCLYKEFVNAPMIPFVLPNILQVLEECTVDEFTEHILPNIKPVLAMEDPPQISLVIIQRIDILLKLCSASVIKSDIVPMLTRALDSPMEQLQELCLAALPSIATLIDGPTMKNVILPRIKKICLKGPGHSTSLSLRVNCLLCLAKMLEHLDRWLVLDQILPFLQEIPHSGEPAVLMALIGIYKLVLTHSKLGINKEILATKVLPSLLPLCIEQSLSPSQFEILAALINDMVNRVTTEHRESLRQLDAVRREAQQLDDALKQTANPSTVDVLNDAFPSSKMFPVVAPLKDQKGLTLEEKHRFSQQQESNHRLHAQSPLTPKTPSQPKKIEPKDLTSTLLENNLSQLNLSATKPVQPNYTSFTSPSWDTNINQNQWKNTNSMPMSLSTKPSNVPINWNLNGMDTSINWGSQSTPNQISQWTSPKPQTNKNNSDSIRIGAMNSMMMPTSPESFNNLQQNKPASLSTQDIIDFLS